MSRDDAESPRQEVCLTEAELQSLWNAGRQESQSCLESSTDNEKQECLTDKHAIQTQINDAMQATQKFVLSNDIGVKGPEKDATCDEKEDSSVQELETAEEKAAKSALSEALDSWPKLLVFVMFVVFEITRATLAKQALSKKVMTGVVQIAIDLVSIITFVTMSAIATCMDNRAKMKQAAAAATLPVATRLSQLASKRQSQLTLSKAKRQSSNRSDVIGDAPVEKSSKHISPSDATAEAAGNGGKARVDGTHALAHQSSWNSAKERMIANEHAVLNGEFNNSKDATKNEPVEDQPLTIVQEKAREDADDAVEHDPQGDGEAYDRQRNGEDGEENDCESETNEEPEVEKSALAQCFDWRMILFFFPVAVCYGIGESLGKLTPLFLPVGVQQVFKRFRMFLTMCGARFLFGRSYSPTQWLAILGLMMTLCLFGLGSFMRRTQNDFIVGIICIVVTSIAVTSGNLLFEKKAKIMGHSAPFYVQGCQSFIGQIVISIIFLIILPYLGMGVDLLHAAVGSKKSDKSTKKSAAEKAVAQESSEGFTEVTGTAKGASGNKDDFGAEVKMRSGLIPAGESNDVVVGSGSKAVVSGSTGKKGGGGDGEKKSSIAMQQDFSVYRTDVVTVRDWEEDTRKFFDIGEYLFPETAAFASRSRSGMSSAKSHSMKSHSMQGIKIDYFLDESANAFIEEVRTDLTTYNPMSFNERYTSLKSAERMRALTSLYKPAASKLAGSPFELQVAYVEPESFENAVAISTTNDGHTYLGEELPSITAVETNHSSKINDSSKEKVVFHDLYLSGKYIKLEVENFDDGIDEDSDADPTPAQGVKTKPSFLQKSPETFGSGPESSTGESKKTTIYCRRRANITPENGLEMAVVFNACFVRGDVLRIARILNRYLAAPIIRDALLSTTEWYLLADTTTQKQQRSYQGETSLKGGLRGHQTGTFPSSRRSGNWLLVDLSEHSFYSEIKSVFSASGDPSKQGVIGVFTTASSESPKARESTPEGEIADARSEVTLSYSESGVAHSRESAVSDNEAPPTKQELYKLPPRIQSKNDLTHVFSLRRGPFAPGLPVVSRKATKTRLSLSRSSLSGKITFDEVDIKAEAEKNGGPWLCDTRRCPPTYLNGFSQFQRGFGTTWAAPNTKHHIDAKSKTIADSIRRLSRETEAQISRMTADSDGRHEIAPHAERVRRAGGGHLGAETGLFDGLNYERGPFSGWDWTVVMYILIAGSAGNVFMVLVVKWLSSLWKSFGMGIATALAFWVSDCWIDFPSEGVLMDDLRIIEKIPITILILLLVTIFGVSKADSKKKESEGRAQHDEKLKDDGSKAGRNQGSETRASQKKKS